MRHLVPLLTACATLLAAGSALAECETLEREVRTNELVIRVDVGTVADQVLRFAPGLQLVDEIPELQLGLALITDGQTPRAWMDQLNRDAGFQGAGGHVDEHEHVDTPEGIQRSLDDISLTRTYADYLVQPAATLTHVPAAVAQRTGRGVLVAIVDGPAPANNVVLAPHVLGPGLDVLGGGPTAAVPPNGVDDDGDTFVDEGASHATHVAGMVHLVAPEAALLFVRVLDDEGKGESFEMARGIVRAVDAGADVINISIGMPADPKPLEKAIDYAWDHGRVIVAGAGNRGELLLGCVDFPADRPEVIGVAAVDDSFVKTPWSSYGDQVALSAPGVRTLSPHGLDGWAEWDGTSFAAPMVAGAAALLLEAYPTLPPGDVKAILKATKQPDANPPELNGLMGAGVLDVGAVMTATALNRDGLAVRGSATGATVSWGGVTGATTYDVVRGDVANLALAGPTVELGPLTCLADDTISTRVTDTERPGPGRAFFYLVRDDAPDAAGRSFGTSSRGEPRQSSTPHCAP